MKTTFTLILCIVFGVVHAQYTLIADYPFTTDGIDLVSGDEAFLYNATFTEGGIYSNGIYAGNDLAGTEITTAPVESFEFSTFKFTLEFRVDSLPTLSWMPIVVGGPSWRWAAVTVQDDGLLAFRGNNGSIQQSSSQQIELGVWHNLEVEYIGSSINVTLNEMEVMNIALAEFNNEDDKRITCSENSTGRNFKGYWRNLKIYGPFTVGTEDTEHNSSIIYPNPTEGNIQLSGWGSGKESQTVHLFDAEGSVVRIFNLNSDPATVNVSGLAPGVYTLRSLGQSAIAKRLVVK